MVSELTEKTDLDELDRLFAEVWKTPGQPAMGSGVLRALAHSGNYVAGVRDGGRLVGGLVGWLGGAPPRQLHLHSHILGVAAGNQARGIGFELKQHQRRWCLERGISLVEWTFDPLVRRNAHFNFNKLGAEAGEYLVNFYGEMPDGLNAGEESDRLLVSWRLDSAQAEAAAAGRPLEPALEDLRQAGATEVLIVGADGRPEANDISAEILLVQVPEDIVEMRRANPAMAKAWRFAMRGAMTRAIEMGHRVTGITKAGWYVLRR